LPGGSTVPGFIATGDFASDDRRAQLAFTTLSTARRYLPIKDYLSSILLLENN
jgi:hypothetical protein